MKKKIQVIAITLMVLLGGLIKVNASEISLQAKYNSTQYSPFNWTGSSTVQWDLYRYKEYTYDSSISNRVYSEEIYFGNHFNTNNYDILEIPFIISTSIIAWERNDDVEIPYCDEYTQNGNTYICTDVGNSYFYGYDTNSLKINSNNISFWLGYNEGGITNCTYNNNVIICPLMKNKTIKSFNFFLSTEAAFYSTYDKFYLTTFQYVNFYNYIDGTQNIINNQNKNTQEIKDTINQNTTYEDKSNKYTNETQEMDEYKNKEKQLLQEMNFTALDNLDITINPETNNFIWNVVEGLRSISGKIVLLMTSVLGLGIIKMILNR